MNQYGSHDGHLEGEESLEKILNDIESSVGETLTSEEVSKFFKKLLSLLNFSKELSFEILKMSVIKIFVNVKRVLLKIVIFLIKR